MLNFKNGLISVQTRRLLGRVDRLSMRLPKSRVFQEKPSKIWIACAFNFIRLSIAIVHGCNNKWGTLMLNKILQWLTPKPEWVYISYLPSCCHQDMCCAGMVPLIHLYWPHLYSFWTTCSWDKTTDTSGFSTHFNIHNYSFAVELSLMQTKIREG